MPAAARHRFTFGPMGAGKSALLIAVATELDEAGVVVATYVPAELGTDAVRSRTGASRPARPLPRGDEVAHLAVDAAEACGAVLIDDAHMLDADGLRVIVRWADDAAVDLHLYGLLLDFRSRLFAASAAALEAVDEWTSLPVAAPCWCGEPAVRNGRLDDGRFVREGTPVVAGRLADEAPVDGATHVAYVQLCRRHWLEGRTADA